MSDDWTWQEAQSLRPGNPTLPVGRVEGRLTRLATKLLANARMIHRSYDTTLKEIAAAGEDGVTSIPAVRHLMTRGAGWYAGETKWGVSMRMALTGKASDLDDWLTPDLGGVSPGAITPEIARLYCSLIPEWQARWLVHPLNYTQSKWLTGRSWPLLEPIWRDQ